MPTPKDDLSNLDLRQSQIPTKEFENEAAIQSAEEIAGPPRRWFSVAIPAWLVSMVVHIALILAMAAYNLPEIKLAVSAFVVNSSPTEAMDAIEDFAIDETAVEVPQESTELIPSSAPIVKEQVSEIPVDIQIDTLAPSLSNISLPSMSSDIMSTSLSTGEANLKKGLTSRSKESKRDLLDRYGGNADTEKAVALALKWLKEHQMPDGSWTFAHGLACAAKCKDNGKATSANNGATGMALMCFLGAGQTHLEGDYKQTVFNGLSYLIRNMKDAEGKMPSWYIQGSGGSTGVMYSHGIASIAMCEAYGMTKDPDLRAAAQASVNFIVYAQDPSGGGWYYSPRAGGDTSVVGWQLMALKSAKMSNLNVPVATLKKAQKYLDAVSSKNGSAFGYRKPNDRPAVGAMTACGLLCKMYLGLPRDNEGLNIAAKEFAKKGPSPGDIYFNYYATQVMKQIGGPLWEEWDIKMKKFLLTSQEKSGHAAGSWHFEKVAHADGGGRLYMTCMSTMMLEVYYRYMPIYGDQSEEESFKL
jgi:hypothetical protein